MRLIPILPGVLFLWLVTACATTKTTTEWTLPRAEKWVKSGTWKNGLKLDVFADVNALEFARQYHANPAIWDKAFAYLKEHDLAALPNGKINLDGDNLTVAVTEGSTRELDKTQWESHQKYIDLQYIARGKEKMGLNKLAQLVVTQPYNPAKDVANYTGDGNYYTAEPGTFYLFFPPDAHRPPLRLMAMM